MVVPPKTILVGNNWSIAQVYPDELLKEFNGLVDWVGEPVLTGKWDEPENIRAAIPEETEIILGTWGMPLLDAALLDKLPKLRAVFYAAGSVRRFATPAVWERGIRVFSAARANAVPVAEFTVAQMVLGLKNVNRMRVTESRDWDEFQRLKAGLQGGFRSRVGLVSYGLIARHVRRLLLGYEHEVLVYDPFIDEATAEAEEITLCGLEDLFRRCPVVSLHAPLLDATRHMIRGRHLESMQEGAVFINTARGGIVHQPEMVEVLHKRPDMTAILDVTDPEPPEAGDPLLSLPNAWVTPHLAGSMGRECARMAAYMLAALKDYLAGNASVNELILEDLDRIA